MNRRRFNLSMLTLSLGSTACIGSANSFSEDGVVLFYSWGGHTRKIAGALSTLYRIPMVEICSVFVFPEDPYETASLSRSQRARNEYPDSFTVPKEFNIAAYKNIWIGAPVWNGRLPTLVRSFLNETPLVGKELYVFSSYQGSGSEGFLEELKSLAPKSVMRKSFFHIESRPLLINELSGWIIRR